MPALNLLNQKSYGVNTTTHTSSSTPTSYRAASANPHWKDAMATKIAALNRTSTWTFVLCPLKGNVVGCKWVYCIKHSPDGSIESYKACLVAKKGFNQEERVYYLLL